MPFLRGEQKGAPSSPASASGACINAAAIIIPLALLPERIVNDAVAAAGVLAAGTASIRRVTVVCAVVALLVELIVNDAIPTALRQAVGTARRIGDVAVARAAVALLVELIVNDAIPAAPRQAVGAATGIGLVAVLVAVVALLRRGAPRNSECVIDIPVTAQGTRAIRVAGLGVPALIALLWPAADGAYEQRIRVSITTFRCRAVRVTRSRDTALVTDLSFHHVHVSVGTNFDRQAVGAAAVPARGIAIITEFAEIATTVAASLKHLAIGSATILRYPVTVIALLACGLVHRTIPALCQGAIEITAFRLPTIVTCLTELLHAIAAALSSINGTTTAILHLRQVFDADDPSTPSHGTHRQIQEEEKGDTNHSITTPRIFLDASRLPLTRLGRIP